MKLGCYTKTYQKFSLGNLNGSLREPQTVTVIFVFLMHFGSGFVTQSLLKRYANYPLSQLRAQTELACRENLSNLKFAYKPFNLTIK